MPLAVVLFVELRRERGGVLDANMLREYNLLYGVLLPANKV